MVVFLFLCAIGGFFFFFCFFLWVVGVFGGGGRGFVYVLDHSGGGWGWPNGFRFLFLWPKGFFFFFGWRVEFCFFFFLGGVVLCKVFFFNTYCWVVFLFLLVG